MRTVAAMSGMFLVLAASAAPGDAVAQRAPEAQALIDRWVEAVGGMESYHAVSSIRFTVTTELYDPESGRLRRTRPRYATIHRDQSGLYARVERWEGNDFIQQGWHPGGQWAVMNGEELGPGDMDYDEADYVGGDLNYWIYLPFKLNDPGVNLVYDADDGRGLQKVTVTFGSGVGTSRDTWRYYFEDGRTWAVEVSYQTERGQRPYPMVWTDIRSVDGFVYVGAREYLDPEGRIRMIVRVHDVEIDPDLDLAIFRRP
jgi:hypothetical protein